MKRAVPILLLCIACSSSGGNDTDGSINDPDGGQASDSGGGMDAQQQNDGGNGNDSSMQSDSSSGNKIQNVFLILMENHGWASVSGSQSSKYIKQLTTMGGHAEAYYTPKGLHPSEPNYIWLEAGDNLGITNDSDPSSNHQKTPDHLVTQLQKANISWKAYAEDIDGKSCPLKGVNLYAPKHTPQVFFDDVTNTNDSKSQNCIDHVRPFTEFANDLKNNTVPRYSFITPNLCNDMHGETTGFNCNIFTTDMIKLGDDWLAKNVPLILASQAYKNGVLFILWDEGDGLGSAQDGPIPLLVMSPFAKVGYKNSIMYTHSSMLRTVEEIFGVPLLRDAAKATNLSDFFTQFP